MRGKPKRENSGHKTGQFNGFKYKARKKVEQPAQAEPPAQPVLPNEASPRTASGSGMTSTSASDLYSNPVGYTRHKFAGKRCQAPKGEGICGAIISTRNPHTNIPVCQPCAARLRDEARAAGREPDLEKIWKHLEARRVAKEKASQLASRPSGVRETAPSSTAEGSPDASPIEVKLAAG